MTLSTPVPTSPEFLVSAEGLNAQWSPKTVALLDGRFVVVWEDASAGGVDMPELRAQIFNADGSAAGTSFLVNATTAAFQGEVEVALLADGRFVVVWTDDSRSQGDTSQYAIRARVFNDDGSESVAEFVVNTTTFSSQRQASVTALEGGGFAVAWCSYGLVGPLEGDEIGARLFNADGSEAKAEFVVNATAQGVQEQPAVASLAGGGTVICWVDRSGAASASAGIDIRARIFDADGNEAKAEFVVNSTAVGQQFEVTVTALAGGGFVVAWNDYSQALGDDSGAAICARMFDDAGNAVGDDFRVNTTTLDGQYEPAVAALSDGRVVIAWTDNSRQNAETGPVGTDIRAQVLNADGTTSGEEFLVDSETAAESWGVGVTALADGRLFFAWSDYFYDAVSTTATDEIRGRFFDPRLAAVTLAGTAGDDQFVGTGWGDSIAGQGGQDDLSGGAGDDRLDGGAGMDLLRGGEGDDTFVVDALGEAVEEAGQGSDTVRSGASYVLGADLEHLVLLGAGDLAGTGNGLANGLSGNAGANALLGLGGQDRLAGQGGDDNLQGGGGADRLAGGAGQDALLGGSEADVLNGGAGRDTLTGGGGADDFVFALGETSANADRILDFAAGLDDIALDNAVFAGLGASGALAASRFKLLGSSAVDADDRVLYDRATGKLFFDADGSGAAARVTVAVLTTEPLIAAGDILVV